MNFIAQFLILIYSKHLKANFIKKNLAKSKKFVKIKLKALFITKIIIYTL